MIKLKDYPINKKIISIYLPLSIIPLIVVAIIISSIYRARVEESSFKNVIDSSKLIINRIEEIANDVDDCSNMLTINLNSLMDQYYENYSI